MKPTALLALTAVWFGSAAVAQMPTSPPGSPDPSRITGGEYKLDPAHTQITFVVNHLGFSLYRGIFGSVEGTMTLDRKLPSNSKLSITIPMNGLVTTVPALTEHLMKADFFDSTKYPAAQFQSTSVTVKGATAEIVGNLTLKGVTKPVTLHAHLVGAGTFTNPMTKASSETIGFEAKTEVKRSDFGLSYGVPLVSDVVPLEISAAFEKSAPK
jgi:polyisoprenoid-binding protein YceI